MKLKKKKNSNWKDVLKNYDKKCGCDISRASIPIFKIVYDKKPVKET